MLGVTSFRTKSEQLVSFSEKKSLDLGMRPTSWERSYRNSFAASLYAFSLRGSTHLERQMTIMLLPLLPAYLGT